MSEEIRVLKEILDNNDLDNYTIDDDECYLNGYARRCLKKVLEEIERLNVELELYKDNQIHLINQLEQKDKIINEVLEYLDISNMSFVDKNEIAIRLKGSDKE